MKAEHLLRAFMVPAFVLSLCSFVAANPAEIKLYKEAYPDAKPKCINCHTIALPKKDGDHELNAYGKKVTSIDAKPTAETYQKAGSIEDFESSNEK